MKSGCSASKDCASWTGSACSSASCHQTSRSFQAVSWPGALHDEHVLDERVAVVEGCVDGGLEGRGCAAPVAAVGGDDDLRLGVVDARVQRLGGEAAEDDRVGGAEPGAREHRDGGLGDHRQVDRDRVALGDPQVGEGVGRTLHLLVEVGVGDVAGVALGLTDEVDRHLVAAAGRDVAVDGVDARVELAVGEPLREGRVAPVEGLGERGAPREVGPGLLRPEALVVGGRLLVEVGLAVRPSGELGRRREGQALVDEVVERLFAHGVHLSHRQWCAGVVVDHGHRVFHAGSGWIMAGRPGRVEARSPPHDVQETNSNAG